MSSLNLLSFQFQCFREILVELAIMLVLSCARQSVVGAGIVVADWARLHHLPCHSCQCCTGSECIDMQKPHWKQDKTHNVRDSPCQTIVCSIPIKSKLWIQTVNSTVITCGCHHYAWWLLQSTPCCSIHLWLRLVKHCCLALWGDVALASRVITEPTAVHACFQLIISISSTIPEQQDLARCTAKLIQGLLTADSSCQSWIFNHILLAVVWGHWQVDLVSLTTASHHEEPVALCQIYAQQKLCSYIKCWWSIVATLAMDWYRRSCWFSCLLNICNAVAVMSIDWLYTKMLWAANFRWLVKRPRRLWKMKYTCCSFNCCILNLDAIC